MYYSTPRHEYTDYSIVIVYSVTYTVEGGKIIISSTSRWKRQKKNNFPHPRNIKRTVELIRLFDKEGAGGSPCHTSRSYKNLIETKTCIT